MEWGLARFENSELNLGESMMEWNLASLEENELETPWNLMRHRQL
jgi:hypothetical protein